MNNIIYDDFIITPENYIWDYYYTFLNRLDKKNGIKFSLFCAKITNPNTKKSNHCIELVEKWLKDEKSVNREELWDSVVNTTAGVYATCITYTVCAINAIDINWVVTYAASAFSVVFYNTACANNINIINKYLQVLLRETKQFQNNKILEQISKVDVDKLELVDWNMITDIMLEEYNIVHEFEYKDIFSRRCLIELLRREYA